MLHVLKVHSREIFYLYFLNQKAPTWSPDSFPEIISNTKNRICQDIRITCHSALSQ
jgi:hypothetical protein